MDLTFVPFVEKLVDQLPTVKGFVIMTDEAHMPETALPNVICYETLMASADDNYQWPIFDERTASSICYSSGTTGNPKGVLFSHRSTVLHGYALSHPDALGLSSMETILVVIPMFHVNAWGIPWAMFKAFEKDYNVNVIHVPGA
jgi:fatty-acyl-CoA synthase